MTKMIRSEHDSITKAFMVFQVELRVSRMAAAAMPMVCGSATVTSAALSPGGRPIGAGGAADPYLSSSFQANPVGPMVQQPRATRIQVRNESNEEYR
jgi:hypothetical protein